MFPEKTKILRRPIGWKDLGEVDSYGEMECGGYVNKYRIHDICFSRLAVGKENGELFLFCPGCMVKIK